METARYKKRSSQVLWERIQIVKKRLPADRVERILKAYPQYDTMKGGLKLRNVLAGASLDLTIIEILEEIANAYESEQTEESARRMAGA